MMAMLSTKASNDSHGQKSSYFFGLQEYEKNPYHLIQNPSGIIQMGLAENKVCADLLDEWMENNPDALGLRRNGVSEFRELALFQDYHGLPAFKKVLVELMEEIRANKMKFEMNKLVLTAGATAANEIIISCLADPGEAFLVPTPYYPGFDRDLKWRTGVQIIPIHCSSSNGFRITEASMEEAMEQAQSLNLRVKGIMITNPSNPLGTTLSQKELNSVVDFATANTIHIVSDEIYFATIFEHSNFRTVMDPNLQKLPIWDRIHLVYSLSKDLGLPGFRVGMIYSNDPVVVDAATKMSSFCLVSSQTQYFVSQIVGDEKFRGNYMQEMKRSIRKRRLMLESSLRQGGVRCLKGNAGLFCWVDMRHLLKFSSFEEEMEIWKTILYEVGINISPGSSFHCSEPGWFRMCFANMEEHTFKVAIHRLKAFLNSTSSLNSHEQLCPTNV